MDNNTLIIVVVAAVLVAAVLHRTWVRAGRPGGIRNLAAQAEEEPRGRTSADDPRGR